jgi:CubicO group peptidase (beta-lactamase class C family)
MDGEAVNGGYSQEKLARIPQMLEAVAASGEISGFVTLIWRDGQVAQVNAVGQRDIDRHLPMTRDTLFRIASMSKPVTSVAAMMLLEQGRLSLQDPITRWAPEFANMRVLKDPAGPLDATTPAARDITVEDLLTHRSGLSYNFNSQGPVAHAYHDALDSPVASPLTPDEWLRELSKLPLLHPPGQQFHYGHSTDVLGFIVGRIMGTSLGQALKTLIFDPLGMADTAFWVPPEKRDRLARLYRKVDGKLKDVSFPLKETAPAWEGGGGGLISTVDDYLKFARMMIGGGEADGVRLLKPETIALMTANRLTPAQREVPFFGLPIWMIQGFGLGVSCIMDAERNALLGVGSKGAFGWPGAFGTWWLADPATDTILIYMIQESSMDFGPETASNTAAAAVLGGRATLPQFQKSAYAALGN